MPLTKQREDVIWNRYNSPVSMEGCVLSLPLWQEDMRLSPVLSYDNNVFSGTVTGATWDKTGRTFSGAEKIAFPDHAALGLTNNLTIVIWVNPGTQTTAYAALISKQDDTSEPFTGYFIDRNNVDASDYRFVFGTGAVYRVSANDLQLTNGVWQQAAVTKSGTTVTMYVNGVQKTSETMTSATIATNGENLQLGDWSDSGAGRRYWIGTIGEVRIYNRALSAGEVAQHYQLTRHPRYAL